jgi:hypothetical protein
MSQKPGRSKRSAWTDVKPADRTMSSVRRFKWHPSASATCMELNIIC